jgi:hypothetical protein
MYQGTTHVLLLTVDETDLTDKRVYVTLRAVTGEKITKTQPDVSVSGSDIAIMLSQQETLALPSGPVSVQVRWVDATGTAGVSETAYVEVDGIMTADYISYQEDDDE